MSSLHPGARDTTHGGIVKVRNADPVASTSSPSDLWHAWGAFRMDNADLEIGEHPVTTLATDFVEECQ